MLVPVLISIYLAFNPFPHTTSIKEFAFYLASAIALGLWAFRKRPLFVDTPLARALLFFIVWVVVTTPFAIDKTSTLHDIYSHLLRYLLLYMMIVSYFSTPKRLNWLAWLIIISSVIFICWALYYYYGLLDYDWAKRLSTGRRPGALGQVPIHVIGFITLCGSMFALHQLSSQKRFTLRGVLVFCLILFGAALFFTQSRGVILALIIAVVVLFFFKSRKVMLAVAGLLVLLVFLTPVRDRFSREQILKDVRIRIYYTMAEVIKDYPVTGIGFGMHSYAKLDAGAYDKKIVDPAKKFKPRRNARIFLGDPHNWVVDLLVRTGPVGLLLYLNVIVVFFRMAIPLVRANPHLQAKEWGICASACFTGFLVAGLFEPTFTHMIEVLQYVLFAMVTIAWRLHRQGALEEPSGSGGSRQTV